MGEPIYQILPEPPREKEGPVGTKSEASCSSSPPVPIRTSLNAVLRALGQFPFKKNPSKVEYILDKSLWTVIWTLCTNTFYLIAILPYIVFLIVNLFYCGSTVVGGDQAFEQQLIIWFILMSVVHIGGSYVCWFPSIRKIESCKLRMERFELERWKWDLTRQSGWSQRDKKLERSNSDGFKKKLCISVTLCICWVGVSAFDAYSGFPIVKETFGQGEYVMKEFEEIGKYIPPIIYLIVPEANLAAVLVALVTVLVSLPQIISLVVLYLLTQEMIGQMEALGSRINKLRKLRVEREKNAACSLTGGYSDRSDEEEVRELEKAAEALRKLSREFKESGKYIVLIETTLAVCFASVLLFYVNKWVGVADVFAGGQPHKAATVFTLCFILVKLIVLVNSGEKCALATERLHDDVTRLKATSVEDHWRIQGLKDTAMLIDIQLSGCGFFGLRRATLTSITGAVVTYLIVLVQFSSTT